MTILRVNKLLVNYICDLPTISVYYPMRMAYEATTLDPLTFEPEPL